VSKASTAPNKEFTNRKIVRSVCKKDGVVLMADDPCVGADLQGYR
jgi:hypothetical protein